MAIDTRADVDDDADTAATALTVAAPGVGVFLRRHPLRTDDLVVPGSAVAAGQVLGLLQIGPLLRPVLAPADAIVKNLLAPHGAPVGYGTPLATLSPTA
jgi:acetyl-CoA carboxylase biotin carboxyl carrier protein